MKDMIATGFFLFVIAAVAGTLLAFTEMATAPHIERNQKLAFEAARKKVLPAATSFREIQVPVADNAVATISLGFDAQKTFVGSVQSVGPKGYGGPIDIVLGCSPDGLVTGIQVKAGKETPGLGTKLQDDAFLGRFLRVVGEKKENTKLLLKNDSGDIDGITAATVSSRAFCKGVREAVQRLRDCAAQIQQGIAAGPPEPSAETAVAQPLASEPSPLGPTPAPIEPQPAPGGTQ